ncbi:Hypothetical predicted protein [Olea europaea subsp. europaea]|uniref:Aminotransferase-like plant mobile domain-containing protein n=1 Tax=Olea europaea subsp. europaea TaxID=158383 RepID=A0A8S0PRQ9_OLEEU|nr:Hypothetical predicted protein [Olea europaea subsp. europaea]
MNKAALLIAVSLAKGTKLALAPAILSDIYRILSTLKGALVTYVICKTRQGKMKAVEAKVTTPFQLMQAWVWERFPTIDSTTNFIGFGGPTLAQWHIIKVVGTKIRKYYLHKMALKKILSGTLTRDLPCPVMGENGSSKIAWSNYTDANGDAIL